MRRALAVPEELSGPPEFRHGNTSHRQGAKSAKDDHGKRREHWLSGAAGLNGARPADPFSLAQIGRAQSRKARPLITKASLAPWR